MERAGVSESGTLIFTAPTSPDALIRAAKELNPDLRILARTTFLSEAASVREAGANVVVTAEAEVALAMTVHVLEELGATADQLDRARDRVRLAKA